DHTYQGIPCGGYTKLTEGLLKDVPVVLNFDYLRQRQAHIPVRKTIYTGPIDEFFEHDLGALQYRGQKRRIEYFAEKNFVQP
ncbi:UDP-galactopyranose mutase, partial [Acinetobacter baumannii]